MIQLCSEKEQRGVLLLAAAGLDPSNEILEGVAETHNQDSLAAIFTTMAAIRTMAEDRPSARLYMDLADMHGKNNLGEFIRGILKHNAPGSFIAQVMLEEV